MSVPLAFRSTGADYIFIPERPPATEDWESEMCDVLQRVSRRPLIDYLMIFS